MQLCDYQLGFWSLEHPNAGLLTAVYTIHLVSLGAES